jgi:hypothetical protein
MGDGVQAGFAFPSGLSGPEGLRAIVPRWQRAKLEKSFLLFVTCVDIFFLNLKEASVLIQT